MYMFNMNWRYNQPFVAPIASAIVPPIHIKHVHASVSYQLAIYQKHNRRGREMPTGYEALPHFLFYVYIPKKNTLFLNSNFHKISVNSNYSTNNLNLHSAYLISSLYIIRNNSNPLYIIFAL